MILNPLNEVFKIAIIGAGYMSKEHIKVFKTLEEVQITGIYSRTKSRAESLANEFYIEGVYDSIEELYLVTRADMVIISVPELSSKDLKRLKSELFPTQTTYGYNPDRINAELILKENYEVLKGLSRNKNVIVQGAPGTGKTSLAIKFLAENLLL